jgi:hypothetical protein
MRNVSLKLSASLLVFVAAAGPAADDDKKNYPGAACLAGSPSADTNISRPPFLGRAFNRSTATTPFVCPAIKDASSIAGGYVWVIDQNPGTNQPVQCSLSLGATDTTYVYTSTVQTDPLGGGTFSSSSPVKLTFSPIAALSDSFYFLRCSVPGTYNGAQSGVLTYQIDEYD